MLRIEFVRWAVLVMTRSWGAGLALNYDLTPWTVDGQRPRWFGLDCWTERHSESGVSLRKGRLCLGLVAILWLRPEWEA